MQVQPASTSPNRLDLYADAFSHLLQMVEEDDVLDGLQERMSAMSDGVQPPFSPSRQGPPSGDEEEDDRPVARRTRAQAPLHHMSIEELEALLQVSCSSSGGRRSGGRRQLPALVFADAMGLSGCRHSTRP